MDFIVAQFKKCYGIFRNILSEIASRDRRVVPLFLDAKILGGIFYYGRQLQNVGIIRNGS